MIITRLSAGTYYLLAELGRTPDPDPWIEEVEEFLYVDVPAQRGAAQGSVALVVLDDDEIVAAAAHRPHPRFQAEHLQAFVVQPARRGAGRGEAALRSVIEHVHTHGGQPYVMWHVHIDNRAMRTVSSRVGDEAVQDGNYVIFTHP